MSQNLPKTRRWTRGEYYQMADLGFFDGRKVELIDGELIDLPPMKNRHAVALGLGEDAFRLAFGPGFWVRPQLPIHLKGSMVFYPDLAVGTSGRRTNSVLLQGVKSCLPFSAEGFKLQQLAFLKAGNCGGNTVV